MLWKAGRFALSLDFGVQPRWNVRPVPLDACQTTSVAPLTEAPSF